jgi:hypothetical protein
MIPIKRGRGRGRTAADAAAVFQLARELVPADFARELPHGEYVATLQRITYRHRTAARCVALGLPHSEVARIVGLTPERITQMVHNDPAFQNLCADYEKQITELTLDEARAMQEKLLIIAHESADEIINRLEGGKANIEVNMSELRNLMGDALSRTVAPPKQTQPAQVAPTKIVFNVGNKILREPGAEGRRVSEGITDAAGPRLIEGTSKEIFDAEPNDSA